MQKIRYFMAVGAGAVITLICVKPDAAPTLPSLTQLRSDLARSRSAATVDPFLGVLIASAQASQALGLPAKDEAVSKSVVTFGKTVVAAVEANPARGGDGLSGRSLYGLQKTSLEKQQRGSEDRNSTSGIRLPAPVFNQVETEKQSNDSRAHGFILGDSPSLSIPQISYLSTDQSKPALAFAPSPAKPAQKVAINSAQTLGDTVIYNALNLASASLVPTPAPGILQKVLEPTLENPGKPVSPLNGASVVQSPAPVTPQPPSTNQGAVAPEYLNPGANPLLFPTQSQEVQVKAIEPITLEQALELAQRNSRDLQIARITLQRNQSTLREALAAEFPTAGLGATFTRSDSASSKLQNAAAQANNPLLANTNDSISSSVNTTVQLSYNLFTAGSRSANIRAAEQQVRFQQLQIELTAQTLRQSVTRAYYSLQQADAQVEISRAAVTDAAQSLRDAQLLEQAGLGTRFEVLQAQVTLSNAQQDLTTALSQQRIARRQIVQLLSLAQQTEVSAADPIEVAGNWELSLEQSIVLAYKNRAELEQQLVRRDIGEQQRIIALASVRPQANLTASYNLLGSLKDDFGPRDGLSLAANLQWNFFDGGAARARAQQARADIALAETNFAIQRNQVRFDVEQAFFSLNSNARNIQTASFALVQAQESLRLARLRFQAGVGTQTDVINQQTALTQARGNRLNAILNYNRALVDLQRAVSNLPDSRLFKVP